MLRLATQAEAVAGLLDSVAVAPKEMISAMEALLDIVAPIGMPIKWVTATPPNSRFLIAQGQGFDKVAYPKLAALWPTGVIPFDMRGEFPRGWDNGRGVDPGRAILSAQAQQVMEHTHNMATWTGDASFLVTKTAAVIGAAAITRGDGGSIFSDADATGTNNPGARAIGTRGVYEPHGENRPRNIAFNYLVRAA